MTMQQFGACVDSVVREHKKPSKNDSHLPKCYDRNRNRYKRAVAHDPKTRKSFVHSFDFGDCSTIQIFDRELESASIKITTSSFV